MVILYCWNILRFPSLDAVHVRGQSKSWKTKTDICISIISVELSFFLQHAKANSKLFVQSLFCFVSLTWCVRRLSANQRYNAEKKPFLSPFWLLTKPYAVSSISNLAKPSNWTLFSSDEVSLKTSRTVKREVAISILIDLIARSIIVITTLANHCFWNTRCSNWLPTNKSTYTAGDRSWAHEENFEINLRLLISMSFGRFHYLFQTSNE